MERLRSIGRIPNLVTILVCSLFFWLIRIPSLFEPYYYGDEMIYLTIGNGLRQGLTLYTEIYDNKTPLLYFAAAITNNLFSFRLLSGVFMFTSIFFIYAIVGKLAQGKGQMAKYSLIVSAVLFSLPIFEVFIANAENYFILPTTAAFYFLVRFIKSQKYSDLYFSGLLFGVAILFKIPTVTDLFAAIGILIVVSKAKISYIKKLATQSITLILGALTPILLSLFLFKLWGNLAEFLDSAIIGNFGYSTSWGGQENTLSQLIILSLLFFVSTLSLWYLTKKGKVTLTFSVGSIWLLGSLIGALLSSRPYPHYLIQTLPALSIMLTILFLSSRKQQVYTVLFLAIYFFFLTRVDFWVYEGRAHFERTKSFLLNGHESNNYLSLYGQSVVDNYESIKIINRYTKEGDGLFVWGDSAPIYALSKRLPPIKYVAYYHTNEFLKDEEVCVAIKDNKTPLIIVKLEEAPYCLVSLTDSDYDLVETTKNYEFWLLRGKE
jgi:Dolichyl-phosphate-mannose-protein mannosyltransferase